MTRFWLGVLTISFVLSFEFASFSALAGTPVYQIIQGKWPDDLPVGIRDSVLVPLQTARAGFPDKAKKAGLKSVVWLRIIVGQHGAVISSEPVYCPQPGFGFEEAAMDAARDFTFLPAWQGPAPLNYAGYYPFVFSNPDAERSAGWKPELRGIDIEAPRLDPLTPLTIKYPKEAIALLREGSVMLRILVNHSGKVSRVQTFSCTVPGVGFEDAAKDAVKQAEFPKYAPNGRPADYIAFVGVDFRLTPDLLKQAGLPDLNDPNPVDVMPTLLFGSTPESPPEAVYRQLAGTVGMAALVDSNGRVVTARVASGSGFPVLDSAALTSAEDRQYKAAQARGSRCAAWVTYDVKFLPRASGSADKAGRLPDSLESLPVPEVLPRFVHFEKSIYPKQAMENGMKGRVKLGALIGEDGSLIASRILIGSGYPPLDSAALAPVSKHAFAAGLTNGLPVKAWMSWTVQFAPGSKDVIPEEDVPINDSVIFPRVVSSTEPRVPDAVKQAGLEGTVWVEAKIGAGGEILSVMVVTSSGSSVLDSLALKNLETFKFKPATYRGKPIESTYRQKIEFKAR